MGQRDKHPLLGLQHLHQHLLVSDPWRDQSKPAWPAETCSARPVAIKIQGLLGTFLTCHLFPEFLGESSEPVCERFSMVEKQREGGAEREGTFLGVKFHNLAFLCGFLVSLSFNLSNGIHCSLHAIVKLR